MTDLVQIIGRNVKLFRELYALTQTELADKIDRTHTTIANLEGAKQGVDFKTIESLSKVFGVSESVLTSAVLTDILTSLVESTVQIRKYRDVIPGDILEALVKTIEAKKNNHLYAIRIALGLEDVATAPGGELATRGLSSNKLDRTGTGGKSSK